MDLHKLSRKSCVNLFRPVTEALRLYRYLWAFVVTAILLTLAAIFTRGIEFIVKDPYALIGLILIFGVGYCFSLYRERGLTSMVVIKTDGLEIHKFKSVSLVRFEEIEHREILNYKNSKNSFAIPEIFLKNLAGVSYYIPINIKNYTQIEQALSAHGISYSGITHEELR